MRQGHLFVVLAAGAQEVAHVGGLCFCFGDAFQRGAGGHVAAGDFFQETTLKQAAARGTVSVDFAPFAVEARAGLRECEFRPGFLPNLQAEFREPFWIVAFPQLNIREQCAVAA